MDSGIDATRLRDATQGLDPDEFERLVADVWQFQGYETRVSRAPGGEDVDVVARKETPYPEKVVVQVESRADDDAVESEVVQRHSSLLSRERADAVVVVTSGAFTERARDVAGQLNVKLIDGEELCGLIAEQGASQYLVRNYFEGVDLTAGDGDGYAEASESDSTARPGLALLSGAVGVVYTTAAVAAVADRYGASLPQPVWEWANAASFAGYAGALCVLGGGVLITLFMLLSSRWVWKLAGIGVVALAVGPFLVDGRTAKLLGGAALLFPILGSFGVFYTDLR